MAKPSEVWVARAECDGRTGPYYLYTHAPKKVPCATSESGLHWDCTHEQSFCKDVFERTTGFKLAPGACVKVHIQVKLVKP